MDITQSHTLSPTISVIMTSLNSARYIQEAVKSILGQTYGQWELIIVDGGSSDETMALLHQCTDPRIRLSECKGLRRSAQLNTALRKASGEFIAIMDSDDIALPERLEMQLNYLDSHPAISLIGTWAEFIDENGAVLSMSKRPVTHCQIMKRLLSFGHPSLSSLLFRKSILEHGQYFNESLQGLEDIEWYLRISSFVRFAILPEVLMKFRQTPGSLSRHKNIENEKTFIHSVDMYFSQGPEKNHLPYAHLLWGIAHYYYGQLPRARKLLLQSIVSEGLTVQAFRYLLPITLIPASVFCSMRTHRLFGGLAHRYRQSGNNS